MISDAFTRVLNEYHAATDQTFPKHPVTKLITKEIPQLLKDEIPDIERYCAKGSVGVGNWAACPWVAIFDLGVTDSAQLGYYPVYLFQEDMSGLYFSLNQGVTDIRATYGANKQAKKILRARAGEYLERIAPLPNGWSLDHIDLRCAKSNEMASFYEEGNICSKYYPASQVPSDAELKRHLDEVLQLYEKLSLSLQTPNTAMQLEEDESGQKIEDLTKLRMHKRVERNQSLVREVKAIHGYDCEACGFNFEEAYGEIGKKYIEAHHLVPVSELKGQIVARDPKHDFAVLCANCHRMIHRLKTPEDLRGLKRTARPNSDRYFAK